MKKRTLISFDWALKSILRQKDNFDVLEGFLTDLLNEKISILELLESESNKESKLDKFNRVDLKAKDSKGREIIIEVQCDQEPDYLERVYYGTSKALVNSMKESYKYKNIKKIISVSIVYWDIFKTGYLVKGSMNFEDLSNNNQPIPEIGQDIFAEYYFIKPESFNDNIKNALDEWVYIFKHSEIDENHSQATNITKAKEKLALTKMSDTERLEYEEYELNKTINEGVIEEAESRGKKIGQSIGEKKGKKLGKKENSIQIALEMIADNEPIEKIIKYTKLTENEIKNLKRAD